MKKVRDEVWSHLSCCRRWGIEVIWEGFPTFLQHRIQDNPDAPSFKNITGVAEDLLDFWEGGNHRLPSLEAGRPLENLISFPSLVLCCCIPSGNEV